MTAAITEGLSLSAVCALVEQTLRLLTDLDVQVHALVFVAVD